MKLKTIILRHFRCYKNETRIEIGDLTTFIGRNDIGKSSILESLEIFFNGELIQMENVDACVHTEERNVSIGCVFTDPPTELVLDVSAKTNLKDEYLLNQEGDLEIHKIFDCSGTKPKESVFARAFHPTIESASRLLPLKNADLKERLDQLNIDTGVIDLRSNPAIRKAIWNYYKQLRLSPVDVPLDEADAKKIWESLKKELPIFALFQIDRSSRDDDSEVQDLMKLAISEAIRAVEGDLEKIKNSVREKAMKVAERTLEKLREIDANAAKKLSPNFKAEPKWDGLFKLTLTGDDGIPINKRGSGIRRLILLSFFRAEAERKQQNDESSGIIYAIEEPETSQHPNMLKLMVDSFRRLSEQDNHQIIFTTHVPGLAGFLPLESFRYLDNDENGEARIRSGNEDVYKEIANALGVLPDNRIRVFVCVEGPNDFNFLWNISRVLHDHDSSIPDLSNDPRITLFPLGGSTLDQWVQN